MARKQSKRPIPKKFRKQLVIGLIGEKGAGKGTFVKILKDMFKNVEHVTTGAQGILGDFSKEVGLTVERPALIKLIGSLIKYFGGDVLARGMKHRIEASKAKIIIYDAVRWDVDVEAIKSLSEDRFNYLFVYVTAGIRKRYERAVARAEKGEGVISFEQFCEGENAHTEKYISSIAARQSQYHFDNSRTEAYFRKQVSVFLEKLAYMGLI